MTNENNQNKYAPTPEAVDYKEAATRLSGAILEFEEGLNSGRFGPLVRTGISEDVVLAEGTQSQMQTKIHLVLDRQGKGWSLWLYDREEWKPLRDCRVELKIAAVNLFPRMMKEAQSRINSQMGEASKAAQDLRALMKVLDVFG